MLVTGVAALIMGLAAGIIGTEVPAQAAPAINYVALGDSYSSGVGAGSVSGSCGQSPNAVISSQLSSLSSSTTLVSIAIGGNDVGFSSIMETCVLESTSSCESAVSAAEQYANTTLPGKLNTMLADIRSHAPNAKIIVLDYPDFYDLSVAVCIGLSRADHQALDNGINDLDGVIQTAAATNGDTFADVRAQFSGHELCDSSGWLHSITLPIGNSYHPTATGQKDGYLPVFSAAATKVGQ